MTVRHCLGCLALRTWFQPAPPVSLRAVAASVTSVVGFRSLIAPCDRGEFVGAAGGEHANRRGADRFERAPTSPAD